MSIRKRVQKAQERNKLARDQFVERLKRLSPRDVLLEAMRNKTFQSGIDRAKALDAYRNQVRREEAAKLREAGHHDAANIIDPDIHT